MIQIDLQALSALPAEPPLSKSALSRFLNRARTLVDLPGEVEVLLTSDAELKRLNRAFRGKNKATDILSFPTPPEISAHHAGDLALSLETAARQATQYGHTLPDELRILILHGLLHLSGLDHEKDHGQMATREMELRAALRLPTSLIARAQLKPVVSIKRPPRARHLDRATRVEIPPHFAHTPIPQRNSRAIKKVNGQKTNRSLTPPSHRERGER